jgi:hypothetical protein
MIKRCFLFILSCLVTNVALSQVDDTTFQSIEEVTVTAEKEKKIVFGDPKYYIVDFSMSDSNALLLMRNLQTYYVYELDESMNFRHKLKLDINADFLFDDCFGNTYVVTKDSVYSIYPDYYGLYLTEARSRRRFMGAMQRCVGSTSEKVIFEKKENYNQDQIYYTVDLLDNDRKVIYELRDTEISRSTREAAAQLQLLDYMGDTRVKSKPLERNHSGEVQGRSTGKGATQGQKSATNAAVEQQINAHRINNAAYSRATFVASHVLQPQYNPLFTLDDSIYVFNHFESRIDVMSQEGTLARSIPITYHLGKHWNEQIYLDRVKKQFYAVIQRKGVQRLVRLAMTDDEQESSSKITKHAYPKKVIVRNGIAYYTYKPNFDANLNKLYMQKL